LSGLIFDVDLERPALAILAKTLLRLGLMAALMIYASLHSRWCC
jgi:hypothetical protein